MRHSEQILTRMTKNPAILLLPMFRVIVLISLLLSSLTLVEGTSASVTYTPGAMIAMTGSNSDVRFDVASALYTSSITDMNPALITGNKTFTGTFYASGIGWIVFASGSSQVSLDCGIQPLSALSSNCTLIGIGWSENVGDIDFANVEYDPTTGLLSGSALTFVGDISLTGIALPLRPVTLDQSTLTANHAATLTTKDAWMYDGGGLGWQGSAGIGLGAPSIVGNKGTYNNVDLSLANDNYTITIEDTNGSKTEISVFIVSPGILTTTATTAPGYYAATFCTTYPTDLNCPDGGTRSATTLTQLPVGPVIADGSDTYFFTLRARDQYGNRVKSGTMKIAYDTTVKNIQTDITDNINYSSIDGDAFVSVFLGSGLIGSASRSVSLTPSDIIYTIASTAPTNIDNIIQLNSIEYNGSDISLPGWKTAIIFDPLFTASVSSTDTPIVNTPHTFETTVTKNDPAIMITPTIITTMQIGDGSMAEWRSLSSNPTAECSNYPLTITANPLCDWSSASVIATRSAIPFAYTGTYTTWLPDAPGETTTMTGYIYYNNGISDILYSLSNPTIGAANTGTQRIRVLGQSGEGLGTSMSRATLINSIRERVALMSRNRTNYDDTDYIVIQGNYILSDMDLWDGEIGKKPKRTLVVIGGDITLDDNITLGSRPIAMIALTDTSGVGGSIKIRGSVTDIHSSLIAEHGIISERSDSQLYIHGSLVSANPPREISPTGCPYFAPSGCIRSDYDLPGQRAGYSALTDKTGYSSIGSGSYIAPLIIQSDSRLLTDTIPILNK